MRDMIGSENEGVAVPFTLYNGDCLEVMRGMADNSVDAIVTDPPYGLEFMGKEWDGADGFRRSLNKADVGRESVFGRASRTSPEYRTGHLFQEWTEAWAREALRVLKPGGHLLSFSGSRTYHRMTCAIEDAGFEIRDQIMWVYGSGFPKSRNLAEQDMSGANAEKWQGWGTALKPAHEPICVARKPLAKGATVAANVLQFGTGALNIDACRVEPTGESRSRVGEVSQERRYTEAGSTNFAATPGIRGGGPSGRWPANLIHDGSDEVVALFPDQQSGSRAAGVRIGMGFHGAAGDGGPAIEASSGSAARFFYCAKANRTDRNAGLASSDAPAVATEATMRNCETAAWSTRNGNHHPTVKPTDLMAYLVRLVTPPGGLVLDPFMGSGSTGKAAAREGFRFAGIDMTPEYVEIARARIEHEWAVVTAAAEAAAITAPQRDLFEEAA